MSIVLESKNRGSLPLSVIFLEIFPAALAAFLLASVGIMHVTSRVMVVKLGYELSKLDVSVHELAREHDALEVELASLKSPSKLTPIAKTELEMTAPSVIIELKE